MLNSSVKSPEALEQEVIRAARCSANAAIMLVRLATASTAQQRAVWEAERGAWEERGSAALAAIPWRAQRQEVSQLASEAIHACFVDNRIAPPKQVSFFPDSLAEVD